MLKQTFSLAVILFFNFWGGGEGGAFCCELDVSLGGGFLESDENILHIFVLMGLFFVG